MFFSQISAGSKIWDSGFEKFFHVCSGRRISDLGCEIVFQLFQDTRFGIWDSRYCLFIFLFRTQDSGFGIRDSLSSIQDTGFGISEIVFSYFSSGRRIWDLKQSFWISRENTGFGIRDLKSYLFIHLQGAGFGIRDSRWFFIYSGHRIWDLGFEILSFQIFLQDAGFGI